MIRKYIIGCALLMQGAALPAQSDSIRRPEITVENTTEVQTDFKGATGMLNCLRIGLDLPMGKIGRMEIAAFSINNNRNASIINDLQGFSNIEAESQAAALAVLGFGLEISRHKLFAGIRNVNEDYFTSGITSFYTNSSCGIFPTLSANYDLANYPLAHPGIHYRYEVERVAAQASVYMYHTYTFLTQAEYRYGRRRRGALFAGACLHILRETDTATSPGITPWAYIEQQLTQRFHLIGCYSHAFGRQLTCTDFAGIGLHVGLKHTELAWFSDFARYTKKSHTTRELATELSAKFAIGKNFCIQPAAHIIRTGGQFMSVGCIRFELAFSK